MSDADAGVWSVDDHLADVLRTVRPLDPIELPLAEALGCVLTQDVTAPAALPPFDNSSMDGYAVRTADVEGATDAYPSVLRVIGEVAAGSAAPPIVGPGQAARIMTGAPLPPGAEAVVPVEWTDGGSGTDLPADAMAPAGSAAGSAEGSAAGSAEGTAGGESAWGTGKGEEGSAEVRVFRPVAAGAHVRPRGGDIAAGTLALPAGIVLGPPQLGLLAATGRASVPVRPRPRVVVLSTGSELVPPGQPLGPGQIHDANGPMLTAAAVAAGAVAYRAAAVADDPLTLRAALADQLSRADLVVTSGGVSVGAYDVVKEAFATPGSGVEFRRLAMQPGKPQGFGLTGPAGTPLFALPGNPVSAYVSFEVFVRPALRTLAGHGRADRHRPRAVARLDTGSRAPLSSPAGRRQFLRGSYTPPRPGQPTGTVRPVGGPGSHLIAALARADALIDIPETVTAVPPGAEVTVVLLG